MYRAVRKSVTSSDVVVHVDAEEEGKLLKCLKELLQKLPEDVAFEYREYLRKLCGSRFTNFFVKYDQCLSKKKQRNKNTLQHVDRTKTVWNLSEADEAFQNPELLCETRSQSDDSLSLETVNVRNNNFKSEEEEVKSKDEVCFNDHKPFSCDICDVKFKTKDNLYAHRGNKHGIKRHKCLLCDDSFLRRTEMVQHFKTHSTSNGIQCPLCQKYYRSLISLSNHTRKIHQNRLQLPCNDCGQVFHSSWLLKSHSRVHSKKQKFVCPLCRKGFPVKKRFLDHINVHSGIKPYKCKDCGRMYLLQSSFRDHNKLHTGDKCLCSVCGKAFATASELRKHTRIHNSMESVVCEEYGTKLELEKPVVACESVCENPHPNVSRQHPRQSHLCNSINFSMNRTKFSSRPILNSSDSDDSEIPLDVISVNRDALDLGTSLFGTANDASEPEEESESSSETEGTC